MAQGWEQHQKPAFRSLPHGGDGTLTRRPAQGSGLSGACLGFLPEPVPPVRQAQDQPFPTPVSERIRADGSVKG